MMDLDTTISHLFPAILILDIFSDCRNYADDSVCDTQTDPNACSWSGAWQCRRNCGTCGPSGKSLSFICSPELWNELTPFRMCWCPWQCQRSRLLQEEGSQQVPQVLGCQAVSQVMLALHWKLQGIWWNLWQWLVECWDQDWKWTM